MIHKTAGKLQIHRPLGENNLGQRNTKENLRPQNEVGGDSEKLSFKGTWGKSKEKKTIHTVTQRGCLHRKDLRP